MSSSTIETEKPEFSSNPFFDALAARPMSIVWALLALILIGVGVVAVMNQRESRAQAGNNSLYQAQKSIEEESKALLPKPAANAPDAAKAPNEAASKTDAALAALEFKKIDVDAKYPNSVKKLQAVAEQYSGTRAGFEASMALGSLYNNHGEPAKAIAWFMRASSTAQAHLDQVMATSSLGYALEGAGKYTEAADSFQKAITLVQSDANSMKADFLLALARNQELMGDKTKARASYDQLISQSPNSDQARSAELLKAKL